VVKNNKELIFTEYYKVVDIIQSYDQHYFKIKAWNVTLSGALLIYGISQALIAKESEARAISPR